MFTIHIWYWILNKRIWRTTVCNMRNVYIEMCTLFLLVSHMQSEAVKKVVENLCIYFTEPLFIYFMIKPWSFCVFLSLSQDKIRRIRNKVIIIYCHHFKIKIVLTVHVDVNGGNLRGAHIIIISFTGEVCVKVRSCEYWYCQVIFHLMIRLIIIITAVN